MKANFTSRVIFSDINECENEEVICPENSECRNSVGSFKCECLPGYSGDGLSCNKDDL